MNQNKFCANVLKNWNDYHNKVDADGNYIGFDDSVLGTTSIKSIIGKYAGKMVSDMKAALSMVFDPEIEAYEIALTNFHAAFHALCDNKHVVYDLCNNDIHNAKTFLTAVYGSDSDEMYLYDHCEKLYNTFFRTYTCEDVSEATYMTVDEFRKYFEVNRCDERLMHLIYTDEQILKFERQAGERLLANCWYIAPDDEAV